MDACCLALSLAPGPFLTDNGPQVSYISRPAALPHMTADERSWKRQPPIPLSSLSLLIRRSQEGDEGAMEKIYEHYKRPLFNLAYRYTSDRLAAEDLLQDIFVKVFSHLGEVDRDETFVAWMYRIAINTCYSYLRSRRSREARSVSLSEIEGKKEEAVTDRHEESLAGPVEEALRTLPEKLRAVFVLHDVEGHTHEEIGRMLGFTVGTSKSQLFKARMRIREFLKEKKVL
jgi:RNA polymerase sigma-70 factor (ECF subfamily)